MKDPMDGEDQKVLLPMLRAFFGWTQEDLAEHAGLDASTVRRYEKGRPMTRKRYEQIVAGTRLPLGLVESCFLPAIRAGRASLAGAGSFQGPGSAGASLNGAMAEARQTAFSALLGELAGGSSAEGNWEAKTWRFVEALCHESEAVASGDADRALKLAQLALRFAERAPGKGERRSKLEGYAWIFIGNAQRVGGALPEADAAFAHAEQAWAAWQGATPILLASWRLPDGKASLRRHQGRSSEAIKLHEQARRLAPPEATGRILLNKAFTQEQQGEPQRALATLREAEARIDAAREPRLLCVLEFNRVVNLCSLERFAEASKRLSAVKSMVETGDKQLDRIRVLWLESRIAAGLGRRSEAMERLDQVRREFLARGIALDTALATLELAVFYLEAGRRAEVARLAGELAELFASQRVPRETLACADLFCKAVQQETVTVELARGWLKELSRRR